MYAAIKLLSFLLCYPLSKYFPYHLSMTQTNNWFGSFQPLSDQNLKLMCQVEFPFLTSIPHKHDSCIFFVVYKIIVNFHGPFVKFRVILSSSMIAIVDVFLDNILATILFIVYIVNIFVKLKRLWLNRNKN